MSGETTFTCPDCDKRYRWKPELAGRRVRCKCGNELRVPDTADELAPETVGAGVSAGGASATGGGAGGAACPSCGKTLSAGAVVCIDCGINIETGEALGTSVGRAVKQVGGGGPRRVRGNVGREGFLTRISRSWQYVKISYGILWDFKQLLVFPLLSLIAAIFVALSFILPLWGTGTMEQFADFLDEETAASHVDVLVYAIAFAYYFCSFFVIVFFNTALSACALRVCAGETPTVGYGLSLACKRLPQIVGWSLVSATVGLILKMIENSNEKVGAIVAAILGTGWTVLTYFVVPVLAAQGVGPVDALKQAFATLKQTWGEALIGNFSIALLTMIIGAPLFFLVFLGIGFAFMNGYFMLAFIGIGVAIMLAILLAVVSSAADMVFRSLLYNYATGQTIPDDIDESVFEAAFGTTQE